MKKFLIFIFIVLLAEVSLFADSITFSGGRTVVKMQGQRRQITLSEGANVQTGDISITAQSIDIAGENYETVNCRGNVKVVDHGRGISIMTPSLTYDRERELITVDGWVEVQDTKNEVSASGAWLSFNLNSGFLQLQIQTKLIKHTDDGRMICRADNAFFDRDNSKLVLTGNASVYWKGDDYKASSISVDLDTEEIEMSGKIAGVVNG